MIGNLYFKYHDHGYRSVASVNQLPELRQAQREDPTKLLKQGIWLYFILLIFEGALRKWFLPGLATPLLIVRDPLAIWLIYRAWKNGLLPANFYLSSMMLIGFLGICTALLVGHGNLSVALYGSRLMLVHFPLIFVIGRIFNREDVVKMGIVAVWFSIPMTILIAMQYFSPQSDWVNRGLGGDMEGSGFNAGAYGFVRPSGTFSFTVGIVHFYNFIACFILFFWFETKGINRLVLIVATICLLAAIPLSISRGLLLGILVSFVFFLIAMFRNPEYLYKIIPVGVGLVIAVLLLSYSSLFQTSIDAFTHRIEMANKIEGGMEGVIGDRYFGGMINALFTSTNIPFFGYGLGMGTNVGSMLLTGGLSYLIAEGEWGRIIGELGALMGITVVFLRMGLCVRIAIDCYHRLVNKDLLPWLLLAFCLLIVPQGQWARPTTLGFSTLIAGLTIASLSIPDKIKGSQNEYI